MKISATLAVLLLVSCAFPPLTCTDWTLIRITDGRVEADYYMAVCERHLPDTTNDSQFVVADSLLKCSELVGISDCRVDREFFDRGHQSPRVQFLVHCDEKLDFGSEPVLRVKVDELCREEVNNGSNNSQQ